MNEKERKEMIEFLDIVDLKIKINDIVNIIRKELLIDYELCDEEILFICDKIKRMVENKKFRVCPYGNDKIINEDCGNCFAYNDCCDFVKGVINE